MTHPGAGLGSFVHWPPPFGGSGGLPWPAFFFSPGNGYQIFDNGHKYQDLITSLVEAGFVVFGVEPSDAYMLSGHRRATIASRAAGSVDVASSTSASSSAKTQPAARSLAVSPVLRSWSVTTGHNSPRAYHNGP